MAIAKVADRASANSNTAVTTVDLVLTGLTVGNYLIIRSAADNTGGGGAARSVTLSNQSGTPVDLATDQVFQQNNDPGAASAGVTCNLGITKISATSGTVRMTYSGSVVQACVAEEWSGIHATTPVVGTPVGASGVNSTNMASCADTSVAAGNVAYAAMAIEGPTTDVYVQDADTTNGTWSDLTKLSTGNVTATDNQTIYGGYKLVSATGAQTYNPTITATARDTAGIIMELATGPEAIVATDDPDIGITETSDVVIIEDAADSLATAVAESSPALFAVVSRADTLAAGSSDSGVKAVVEQTLTAVDALAAAAVDSSGGGTERLAPDAILTQTNLTGALANIQDDPDAPGGSWTPDLLPSLRFWLKADAITGLSDGAAVASWLDSSGSGHDGSQGTAINRPTYQTNILNGLPAVEFNGTHDLDISGLAAEISADDTYSLFILNQPRSFTIHPIMFTHPTTTDWNWIVEYNNFGDLYWGHVNGNYRLYDTNVAVNDWPILSVIKTAATTGTVRKSGTEITVFTPTGSGMQATPSLTDTVRMGAYYNHTIGFDGFIPEVIYCDDALSTADIERVEGYLAHKWGRTADLPGGHTYKSAAPLSTSDTTWLTESGASVLRTSFPTPTGKPKGNQEIRIRVRPS